MQSIRSTDTKFEIEFRKLLWASDVRGYRLHWPIHGKPDLAWPGRKIAVFLDSDFWHGWKWEELKPQLKNDFWKNKISSTMRRDRKNTKKLEDMGWKVIRIWEHEIKEDSQACVKRIHEILKNVF